MAEADKAVTTVQAWSWEPEARVSRSRGCRA